MAPWNCCRTCLGVTSLNPISPIMEQAMEENDEYLGTLLLSTGLKIQIHDELPQEICTPCMDIVTNFIKFQKKCKSSYKILLEHVKKNKFNRVKIEPNETIIQQKAKTESCLAITDLIGKSFDKMIPDNDVHDYCDNINDNHTDNDDIKSETIEFEATVEEILKKHKTFTIENLPNNFIRNVKVKSDEINLFACKATRDFNIEIEIEELQSRDKNITEEIPQHSADDILEPYECQTCHKVYKNKFSYLSHRKIHDGMKVVCEHCGKSFLDKRRLLMHCKAKHGYQKTDKCSFCDYTGASKEAVKIHERLHTGEKPYVCDVCSASFHRKSSYLQHKPIHLSEKTVQCDICPALFKSVTLMRIHKTKHKPREYKHKCLICGTSFGKRWHCLRHLQRIHGVTDALDTHLERVRLNDIEK